MALRLRLPEVLKEHGLTAHAVARLSEGRINPSTLYRLSRERGRVRMFDGELLEALADVLGCEVADLIERDKGRRAKAK